MTVLVVTSSLCKLCALCVSVVGKTTINTETQRTQSLHREEENGKTYLVVTVVSPLTNASFSDRTFS